MPGQFPTWAGHLPPVQPPPAESRRLFVIRLPVRLPPRRLAVRFIHGIILNQPLKEDLPKMNLPGIDPPPQFRRHMIVKNGKHLFRQHRRTGSVYQIPGFAGFSG